MFVVRHGAHVVNLCVLVRFCVSQCVCVSDREHVGSSERAGTRARLGRVSIKIENEWHSESSFWLDFNRKCKVNFYNSFQNLRENSYPSLFQKCFKSFQKKRRHLLSFLAGPRNRARLGLAVLSALLFRQRSR